MDQQYQYLKTFVTLCFEDRNIYSEDIRIADIDIIVDIFVLTRSLLAVETKNSLV